MRKFVQAKSAPPPPFLKPTLRKLIRSKVTQSFLTTRGGWTNDIQRAAQYASYYAVLDTKREFDLQDVEVYYAFGGRRQSQYDFAVSM